MKDFLDRYRTGSIHLALVKRGRITFGQPTGATGSLGGGVTSRGRPWEGAMIMVTGRDPVRGNSSSPGMAFTGRDGRFQVECLPGGKYRVLVMTKVSGGAAMDRTMTVLPTR